ncbi:LVIVD repeat-containing protein, partial [Gemmatimonadota bacterium]
MRRAVRVQSGGMLVIGVLVGLLFFQPGDISAQAVPTRTVKPAPQQIYTLPGGTESLIGQAVDEDEQPDWKLNPDLPVPVRPSASFPGGLQRSAASDYPTMISSVLWSNFQDVKTFEIGGTQYAVAALVAGLKFFELSSSTPLLYYNWFSETGAFRLAVEGTRLYVVDYWETQVHIFDISNPAEPSEIGTYTPSLDARILNIAVENNILYLARNLDGLEIVDCSNAASPTWLASYGGVDLHGGRVRDVEVGGGYVFLPLHDAGEFQVLDVSTPSAPTWFWSEYIPNHVVRNVEYLNNSSFHSSEILCLVSYANEPAVEGYDISIDFFTWVPGSGISWTNWITLNATEFGLFDEVLFEDQAYFSFGNSGTAAIDIGGITTGTSPTWAGSPAGQFAATAVAVDPVHRSLLISESYGGIVQVNLFDDTSPLLETARVEQEGGVYTSHRRGNLIFVANRIMGLTVLDVTDPYNPQILNRNPTSGSVSDLVVDWPWIYVAEREAGISVITYDIPGNSFTTHSYLPAPTGEQVQNLALKTSGIGAWEYLYAAARSAGVMIIDISNPDAISHVGTIPYAGAGVNGSFQLCYLEEWDQLAIAQFEDGVSVYDIFSPTSPTLAFTLPPQVSRSNRVGSDDSGNLWVSDESGQVDAWDISTSSPVWLGAFNPGWSTYREIVPFETNALLAGGWQGMQILNWSDPAAAYEETWVSSAGFNIHNFPGTDFFVMSNLYELAIFETPQNLFLDVQPDNDVSVTVGSQTQFNITSPTSSTWWWVDLHTVDGRDIATIDANGLLTGVAGGITRVYGYDDSGKWGISGQVRVEGGATLIDDTIDYEVADINDTNTFMTVPALTFNEPVEIEIVTLDASSGLPKPPPSGYGALSAYDIIATLFWSGNPLTSGDFNNQVVFYAVYDPVLLPGGIPESAVGLWRYNDSTFQWEEITILGINESDNYVIADLQGFSTYAVFAPTTTLSTPTLVSPTGGAWINDRRDIELSWNTISGAVDYEVELAIDPAFGVGDIVTGGNDTDSPSYLTIDQGELDGNYYWRVRGTDGTVWSEWSETGYFVLDDTLPNVSVQSLPSSMPLNTAVAITANASDNQQLDLVRLWYRETGQSGPGSWRVVAMTNTGGDSYSGEIPGSYVSWDGFQYLVQGRDAAMNSTFTTAEGEPAEGEFGSVTLQFGSLPHSATIPSNRWVMVSIPHTPDERIAEHILANIGGIDNTAWRFFRWTGTGYQEETSWGMETGRAYWLYHRQSDVHFEIGQGSTVPSGQPFNITLQSGWNDIASPWLFSVPWDSVMTASGLTATQVVGTYNYELGSSWSLPSPGDDEVLAWRGVSVYNRTGGNLTLLIPPVSPGGSTALLAASTSTDPVALDGWQIQLLLSQEGAAGTDEQNFIGVRSDALPDWDPADYPDPPISLEGTARLAIDRSTRNSD